SYFYEGLPKVPEGINAELEKPFTKGELYDALKTMECGKAPGIDGIPRVAAYELQEGSNHPFAEER
ncbi:hypothetical protein M9458_051289, partial [Cirrhinus mrigala]